MDASWVCLRADDVWANFQLVAVNVQLQDTLCSNYAVCAYRVAPSLGTWGCTFILML